MVDVVDPYLLRDHDDHDHQDPERIAASRRTPPTHGLRLRLRRLGLPRRAPLPLEDLRLLGRELLLSEDA